MSGDLGIGLLRLPGHDPELPEPAYASAGAAGMDVCACLDAEMRGRGMEIAPGARALVPTGLAFEIPPGFEVQVRPRSGLALRHGVTLVNAPGTIDSDYRGELGILVINHGREPFRVTHGMRIAQLVAAPVVRARLTPQARLGTSDRGAGGFGSTGTAAHGGGGDG